MPKMSGKKAENGHMSSEHSEGRGNKKQRNESNQKANEQPPPKPLNFDFLNVPKEVTWTCGPGGVWRADIGGHKIPESAVQDWHRAFTFVTSGK